MPTDLAVGLVPDLGTGRLRVRGRVVLVLELRWGERGCVRKGLYTTETGSSLGFSTWKRTNGVTGGRACEKDTGVSVLETGVS